MSFYITSIIVGLCFTVFIYGYIWNQDECKFAGIAIGILAAIVGFGPVTSLTLVRTKTILTDFQAARTNDHVMIELPDGYIETFNDAATYNNIDKVKKVIDNRDINFYGFEIKRYITLQTIHSNDDYKTYWDVQPKQSVIIHGNTIISEVKKENNINKYENK